MTQMVICKNCGELEEFEPDKYGLNYYQSIGRCPNCGEPTYYKDGKPTKEPVAIQIVNLKQEGKK